MAKMNKQPASERSSIIAETTSPDAGPDAHVAEPTEKETPFEALASICSVLVIGLFILTFLTQNFVIPSGSMEKTLLIGDHLLVDRITLAPRTSWMPLSHYREPKHGDLVVFFKPVLDPDSEGRPQQNILVKRLIGLPGDRIHLRNGVVFLNGVAQNEPYAKLWPQDSYVSYNDDFPSVPPSEGIGATAEWEVVLPTLIQGNDMVVPPGMYFMMGDHRHSSLDSRFWGFVPKANIIGRPLLNYWSFETPADQMYKTSTADQISWMTHVVLHFFSDTRWKRTLHPVS